MVNMSFEPSAVRARQHVKGAIIAGEGRAEQLEPPTLASHCNGRGRLFGLLEPYPANPNSSYASIL